MYSRILWPENPWAFTYHVYDEVQCLDRLYRALHSKNHTTCSGLTVENSIEQCFTTHIVQCCQQYCSALLHLIVA